MKITPEDYCRGMEPAHTHPDFWDCECESDYIHAKDETNCVKCGTPVDDRCDSRVNEVDLLIYGRKETNER